MATRQGGKPGNLSSGGCLPRGSYLIGPRSAELDMGEKLWGCSTPSTAKNVESFAELSAVQPHQKPFPPEPGRNAGRAEKTGGEQRQRWGGSAVKMAGPARRGRPNGAPLVELSGMHPRKSLQQSSATILQAVGFDLRAWQDCHVRCTFGTADTT